MTQFRYLFTIIPLVGATLCVKGDTLLLRDGKGIDGTLVGASARQINFLPTSGQTMTLPVSEVASVSFSAPKTAPAQQPAKKASRAAVLIPQGTAVRVRTIDPIDADVSKAGGKVRGSIDDPIMLGGNVVVPRGSDVVMVISKVAQGGRFKGSDLIELKVQSISVGGRSYPVVTGMTETKSSGEGKKTTRKVIGGTGLGAIVGGIAGGGKGAAIGALAGGAAGTVMAASGQPHLKIPPETRLEFQLLADWEVK